MWLIQQNISNRRIPLYGSLIYCIGECLPLPENEVTSVIYCIGKANLFIVGYSHKLLSTILTLRTPFLNGPSGFVFVS
ncbi:hypothetical protein Lalb_Chr14g0373911 [Lupinus albus]|uniref:Uncharacterized protein n=1 Tax=Lupinus albus TaxID=3870 RepID=A0A6A4PGE2_LUPAL|nr:hypothetical protein Lalb_Chr14g0373911 [Lupinus albus]